MKFFTLDLKRLSFLILLLLLVGCSMISVVKRIEFDKTANNHIKTIALLRIDEPTRISVVSGEIPAGALFGAVGVGVKAASVKKRSSAFRQALNEHHIQFAPAMVEELQQELAKKGYRFTYLQNQSLMDAVDGNTFDLSKLQTDADAILFVEIFGVGYYSQQKRYRPLVNVQVRLFDARSNMLIYCKGIIVQIPNENNGDSSNNDIIFPDEDYYYDSIDALMSNIDEAARGLLDCQSKIAVRIADQLK